MLRRMGIGTAFRLASDVAGRTKGGTAQLRSPWSAEPSPLHRIVLEDIYGTTLPAVRIDRAEAMRVPALVKGRSLICGTLSRQPLARFRGAEQVAADAWMYRTSTAQPPRTRMLWTLDDLIFYGTSLWAVQRGAKDQIVDALRVPPEWWEVDEDLTVAVNGREVSAEEVVLFEGPQDGLLTIAAETIRGARSMDRTWISRVETPVPLTELHSTDPNMPLTDDEVEALVSAWDRARRHGGTAYTPAQVEARMHGDVVADLFTSGRNMLRLDVANFLGLPANLLDGSTSTASLTYSTKADARNELVDLSLSYWANPVEARLSQDDVVPAGTRVAFDLEYLSTPTQPAQGPAHED